MSSIEIVFVCDKDEGIVRWSYLIYRECEIFLSNRKFDTMGDSLEDVLNWIETSF